MAGLPGSVSDVSMLSLGLHSLVDIIFMLDMAPLSRTKNNPPLKTNSSHDVIHDISMTDGEKNVPTYLTRTNNKTRKE